MILKNTSIEFNPFFNWSSLFIIILLINFFYCFTTILKDKKNTLALDRANAAQQRKVNAENKIRERERLAYNKSIQPHTTTRRTVSRTNTTTT